MSRPASLDLASENRGHLLSTTKKKITPSKLPNCSVELGFRIVGKAQCWVCSPGWDVSECARENGLSCS